MKKRPRSVKHDGLGLEACSPLCKACLFEVNEILLLGPPPPPDLLQCPRGAQVHAHKGKVATNLRRGHAFP